MTAGGWFLHDVLVLAARGKSRAGQSCVLVAASSLPKLGVFPSNTPSFRRLDPAANSLRLTARDFRHRLLGLFWWQFERYAVEFGFTPWATCLIHNHYHTIGYLRLGENLGGMMERIHGSVAKLVNDLLPERRVPFWRESVNRDYFDGCLRDEGQARKAYRYILMQPVRAGLVRDWRTYSGVRVGVEIERAVQRAKELKAFPEGVDYPRYSRGAKDGGGVG